MEKDRLADLLIFGAGGHAKVASDCAREMYSRQIMISGDAVRGEWGDVPILPQCLRTFSEWRTLCPLAFVAIGDAVCRAQVLSEVEAAGFTLVTLIHPTAVVSPSAQLGPGVLVCPGAVINADARIGKGCIVNTGAVVEHECEIGAFSHIAPKAVLGGGAVLGPYCWVCLGAVVSDHITIGGHTTIGAGAAALSPLPERVLAAGIPARVLKRYPAEH